MRSNHCVGGRSGRESIHGRMRQTVHQRTLGNPIRPRSRTTVRSRMQGTRSGHRSDVRRGTQSALSPMGSTNLDRRGNTRNDTDMARKVQSLGMFANVEGTESASGTSARIAQRGRSDSTVHASAREHAVNKRQVITAMLAGTLHTASAMGPTQEEIDILTILALERAVVCAGTVKQLEGLAKPDLVLQCMGAIAILRGAQATANADPDRPGGGPATRGVDDGAAIIGTGN